MTGKAYDVSVSAYSERERGYRFFRKIFVKADSERAARAQAIKECKELMAGRYKTGKIERRF